MMTSSSSSSAAAAAAAPGNLAGRGSVLTASGRHELEASVMCCDGRCGAATLLEDTQHPVQLARAIMEHTPHILLAGRDEGFGLAGQLMFCNSG